MQFSFKPIKPVSKPKILIDRNTYDRILYLIRKCPTECQWYSTVLIERDKENIKIQISGIFIPEQSVTAATVESSDEQLMKMWSEFSEEEQDAYMAITRCWSHSHVDMGVSPSGTDEKQWMDWVKAINFEIDEDSIPMMMIWNRRGEVFNRIYDVKSGMIFENVPMEIISEIETSDLDEALSRKIKQKEIVARTMTSVPSIRKPAIDFSHYMNSFNSSGLNSNSEEPKDLKRLTQTYYCLSNAEAHEIQKLICLCLDSLSRLEDKENTEFFVKTEKRVFSLLNIESKYGFWSMVEMALKDPSALHKNSITDFQRTPRSKVTSFSSLIETFDKIILSVPDFVEILDCVAWMWNDPKISLQDYTEGVNEIVDIASTSMNFHRSSL